MIPVMKIRIGATSAESMPPAPNSDQKMGSWERFMSHPPYDDVDQDRGAQGGKAATRRDSQLRQRTAGDPEVGRRLGRDQPPGVGVIADREQSQPMEQQGAGARKCRAPRIPGSLAL